MPLRSTQSLDAATREPLIDANALAVELGVSRDWVYEHADELCALRLGNGPKARLRFDPATARAALEPENHHGPATKPRRRSPSTLRPVGSVLPIRERQRRRKAQ
jgi:hypothetical protein